MVRKVLRKNSTSDSEGEPSPENFLGKLRDTVPEVLLERILAKAEELNEAKILSDSFMSLSYLQKHLSEKYPLSSNAEGKYLNRYRDVLPYAHNTIKIETPLQYQQGDVRLYSDYVNASWIADAQDAKPKYIACQGPLEHTSESFWQMVLEQQVSNIIMLTAVKENGREKCHSYFPTSTMPSMLEYQDVAVFLEKEEQMPRGVVMRELRVKCNSISALVKHFQLQTWPDHGVPKSPKSVYGILDILFDTSPDSPVVVHCSAGIGRTGVVVALDIMIKRICFLGSMDPDTVSDESIERAVALLDIVAHMRHQRAGMVQTPQQLRYCIEVLICILQDTINM